MKASGREGLKSTVERKRNDKTSPSEIQTKCSSSDPSLCVLELKYLFCDSKKSTDMSRCTKVVDLKTHSISTWKSVVYLTFNNVNIS